MRSVAVLGASGVLGKSIVDELIKQNISVKILVRDIERYKSLYPNEQLPGRVNVVQGDLDTNQSLATVLEFVDTIFICFNTELDKWGTDMIRWIDRIASLASALEARIVYPGCVYNFGIHQNDLTEESEQNAPSEIGQLKIAVEKRLYRAAQEGANLTIVRLPEIYGPADLNSPLRFVFENAINNKVSKWRGDLKIKHEFIYSKDAAKALVRAGSSDKGQDKVFHYSGTIIPVDELVNQIHSLANSTVQPKIEIVPKIKEKLYGLISNKIRLQTQLRYLNENEIFLDDKLYIQELGEIERIPLSISLKETIEWYQHWFSLNY